MFCGMSCTPFCLSYKLLELALLSYRPQEVAARRPVQMSDEIPAFFSAGGSVAQRAGTQGKWLAQPLRKMCCAGSRHLSSGWQPLPEAADPLPARRARVEAAPPGSGAW